MVTVAHVHEWLAEGRTRRRRGYESNLRLLNHESDVLTIKTTALRTTK